jgi:hypothetical protein
MIRPIDLDFRWRVPDSEKALSVASLVNASGDAVQPASVNVATALEAATLNPDLTQNLTEVVTDPQPSAYPLSAYSYLVTPCSPSLALAQRAACDGTGTTSPFLVSNGQELGQFVDYLTTEIRRTIPLSNCGSATVDKHHRPGDVAHLNHALDGVIVTANRSTRAHRLREREIGSGFEMT